jgi:hypothetical protein
MRTIGRFGLTVPRRRASSRRPAVPLALSSAPGSAAVEVKAS